MMESVKSKIVEICFLSCFLFVRPEVSAAQGAVPSAAEELLEHAVAELKTTMKISAEKNLQLGEKNNALRKKAVACQEQVAALQQERDALLEAQKNLSADLDLQEIEQGLLVRKLKTMKERARMQIGEKARLEESLTNAAAGQLRLSAEVNVLQEELLFFKRKLKQKDTDPVWREKEAVKDDLEMSIRDSADAVEYKKNEIQELKAAVARESERKAQLLAEQRIWQERLMQLEAGLEKARKRKEQLVLSRQTKGQEQDDATGKVEAALRELRERKAVLEKLILDSQDVQREVIRSSWGRESAARLKNRLVLEQDLLRKKIAVLRRAVFLPAEGALKAASQTQSSLPVQRSRAGQRQLVRALNVSLKKNEALCRDYSRQEERLSRDIAGLKNSLAVLPSPEEDGLEVQKKLLQLLADVEDKGETPVDVDSPKTFDQRRLQEDIEALKFREEVLSNSLALIQERYQAEKSVVESFKNEEQDLEEYRALLQRENKNLQEKVLTLMMAVNGPASSQ